jgi:uncharacterized protein involved in response to NO
MSALATRIETQVGRALTPGEIFEITRARETSLSRLLMLYITTGLAFMLLPGTFLGVWNLLEISSRHASNSVSAGWVQAHGHAQIFGWIGTFILGIGFYSIPKLRRMNPFALWTAWVCWVLWTLGVSLRWLTGVYQWQWRVVLPVSAALEVLAFAIFFYAVSGHRPQDSGKQKLDEWVGVVIVAAIGLLLTLLVNLGSALFLAYRGISPDLPTQFDQRFLVLETWGFLVPFVWGFSAKWLPVFLGLRPVRGRVLLLAVAVNSAGVIAAMMGSMRSAVFLLLGGIIVAVWALRFFERTQQPAKVKGVHTSFPVFVRLAYVWAIVAAALGIWASLVEDSHGIWGCIASRADCRLPGHDGVQRGPQNSACIFRNALTLQHQTDVSLTATARSRMSTSCQLRDSRISFAGWVWSWLPVSAVTEMTAVTIFAANLLVTFVRRPAAQEV